jgi:hypothetical protein
MISHSLQVASVNSMSVKNVRYEALESHHNTAKVEFDLQEVDAIDSLRASSRWIRVLHESSLGSRSISYS